MNISTYYHESKRGTRGRRLLRHLNDAAVARAVTAASNPAFQARFLNTKQRWAALNEIADGKMHRHPTLPV